LTTAQITSIGAEYESLGDLIDNISANTKFGEKALLAGDLIGVTVQYGPNSSDTFTDDIIGANADHQFATLSPNPQTGFTDAAGAQTAMDDVDAAITALSTARATTGQYMSLIASNLEAMLSMEVNVASVVSTVGDADLAAEISNMARDSILAQSATAALMQSNIQSQIVLKLLQ